MLHLRTYPIRSFLTTLPSASYLPWNHMWKLWGSLWNTAELIQIFPSYLAKCLISEKLHWGSKLKKTSSDITEIINLGQMKTFPLNVNHLSQVFPSDFPKRWQEQKEKRLSRYHLTGWSKPAEKSSDFWDTPNTSGFDWSYLHLRKRSVHPHTYFAIYSLTGTPYSMQILELFHAMSKF